MWHKGPEQGFTILEVLVVTSIIAILAGAVVLSMREAQQQGRNAEREAAVRTVQAALENYKRDNGVYPEGCNGPNTWSGEPGTDHECTDGSADYIVALAAEYVPVLPQDPLSPTGNAGFVYRTNPERTVYKFMALNTVEPTDEQVVTSDHELRSCDIVTNSGAGDIDIDGWCSDQPGSGDAFPNCVPGSQFSNSYGVWGGVAELPTASCGSPALQNYKPCRVQNTTAVICQ